MASSALPLLSILSYSDYPSLITSAIQKITYATSVLYNIPTRILTDCHFITEHFNVNVHCIVSRFWTEENQHTIVFLSRDYQGELMLSPAYPIA